MGILGNTHFAAGRHVPDQPFGHFDGSFDELLHECLERWEKRVPSDFNSAAMVVELRLPGLFRSVYREMQEGESYERTFGRRAEGEDVVPLDVMEGDKAECTWAYAVFYPSELLAPQPHQESGELGPDERIGDAEWYLVSLNTQLRPGLEPMDPVTMARNQKELPGGTKPEGGVYTPEQWAEAVWVHRNRVRVGPPAE